MVVVARGVSFLKHFDGLCLLSPSRRKEDSKGLLFLFFILWSRKDMKLMMTSWWHLVVLLLWCFDWLFWVIFYLPVAKEWASLWVLGNSSLTLIILTWKLILSYIRFRLQGQQKRRGNCLKKKHSSFTSLFWLVLSQRRALDSTKER